MSSEFIIAVSHEFHQQNNVVNKGKEGKMYDEDYVNNHLEQKLSLGVPEFSCIRNFPFSNNTKYCDTPVPNHVATKRHTLDDGLNTSLPKLIKLQPELNNFLSGTAVDIVDAVRSQVIKNDVILGETLENPPIKKNERTDAIVEEISLQQLAHETIDACNSDHISVEAIGCAALEEVSCSDRKPSDHQQVCSKIETESAILKIQDGNENSTSLSQGQDCVTETENLLLNSEKRVFFAHEFVGSETEADEYHSVHDSFSLSEFLICPTGFEQKVSCDALLHTVQKEKADNSSVSAVVDVSTGIEKNDAHAVFHCESEMLGDASTTFALDSKSDGKDVLGITAHPLCETWLLHSAEEGTSSDLSQNKMPGSVGMMISQTVVKEELSIKQEVEEDPIPHTMPVPSVDLLHNRELDLVDDDLFQNWFMSLVNQESVTESGSASTFDHHESSGTRHSEVGKEYSVEPNTKIGDTIIGRDLPTTDLIRESLYVKVADHYADDAQHCDEENVTPRFLQNLFSDVADLPSTKKTEESFEKMKNACDELLLTDLSTPSLPKIAISQITTSNVQPSENRPDFAATLQPNVDNNAKTESDIIRKHHKKELIKKFSSGLLSDGKSDNRSSQNNRTQTDTAIKYSDLPSTSAAVTNEDNCKNDCIVISDSDDDSIIEFDIVKTCTKKRCTKSTLSGSSGKNIRKCTRNAKSSTNEESLGQQIRNSTIKNSVIQECIVLSDSDDESSKPELSSNGTDEAVNILDAESHVTTSDRSPRDRTESHGVIDLSGGRSPSAMSKSNIALSSVGDSNVGVFATSFATGDSQCSLAERLGAHNSGLVTKNNNTFTHIVAATITYNADQSNFGRKSNGGDVIDLSRRNLTPMTASWENNKTNSSLDVLDLSGSDKKQQERHSVIRSVGSATENKSTTKNIAEDKDSSPAWSCPICFESLLSGQSVSSTPCGHVFCTKCIEEAVNQFKKCPTCCRKVALKRVHKIFL